MWSWGRGGGGEGPRTGAGALEGLGEGPGSREEECKGWLGWRVWGERGPGDWWSGSWAGEESRRGVQGAWQGGMLQNERFGSLKVCVRVCVCVCVCVCEGDRESYRPEPLLQSSELWIRLGPAGSHVDPGPWVGAWSAVSGVGLQHGRRSVNSGSRCVHERVM